MSAELNAQRHDTSLVLTLSNPAEANALHPDIFAALIESMTTAERDDSVSAVIITGASSQFCGDITQTKRGADASTRLLALGQLNDVFEAIRSCPKPVIAAVEGKALGAGFSLALACDFIVASEEARFGFGDAQTPYSTIGFGAWSLAQTLPRALLAELALHNAALPAPRLHALGIINAIAPVASALDLALQWAAPYAARDTSTVERTKIYLNTLRERDLASSLNWERQSLLE